MREQADDNEIIQLVLQGQQSAYSVLVERYQQYVFTLAYRFVNNREIAEELAQDVFVKAYRYLADFKGNSKFSTWLYTIVNTTCLSHLRKKGDGAISLAEEHIISIVDNNGVQLPNDLLQQKTQKQMLDAAMRHLPDGDAQLLTLFYQSEQSLEEIGIIMGQTPNNIKVRLFRARGKLKEILTQKFSKELM